MTSPATPERSGAGVRRALALAIGAGIAAALWWGVRALQAPLAGPAPVAWDRVRCARCSMLVSEPAFAAQLQRADGAVLQFDDPGCLLLHQHEHADENVRAVWLHLHSGDAWIPQEEAVFEPVPTSPMGYGLATRAAHGAPPGTLSAAQALERARARDAQRRKADDDGAP